MCGGMCGDYGMGQKLTKEQKMALLERREKILQADMDMIRKMREAVGAGKKEE